MLSGYGQHKAPSLKFTGLTVHLNTMENLELTLLERQLQQ